MNINHKKLYGRTTAFFPEEENQWLSIPCQGRQTNDKAAIQGGFDYAHLLASANLRAIRNAPVDNNRLIFIGI